MTASHPTLGSPMSSFALCFYPLGWQAIMGSSLGYTEVKATICCTAFNSLLSSRFIGYVTCYSVKNKKRLWVGLGLMKKKVVLLNSRQEQLAVTPETQTKVFKKPTPPSQV
jgi:hypothetical protein